MKRPTIVDNYAEYEQCRTLGEIKRAIKNGTYRKHYDGRAFRKTFRQIVSEIFRNCNFYDGRESENPPLRSCVNPLTPFAGRLVLNGIIIAVVIIAIIIGVKIW
jgi:hypothetical protein